MSVHESMMRVHDLVMQTFPSGAKREQKLGKGRYDLMSPWALARKARVLEQGALIHGDRNWEKGMPISGFLSSALRHIAQYLTRDNSEDHLAQAGWNLDCVQHIEVEAGAENLPLGLLSLLDCGPHQHRGGVVIPPPAGDKRYGWITAEEFWASGGTAISSVKE